jgi:hypothetical protein
LRALGTVSMIAMIVHYVGRVREVGGIAGAM